ncbi:MAG TPA: BrnT family toxin [Xanthobacteraceae bacterium]
MASVSTMEFEWDETKSERNRRERGFDFERAALIFEGPVIEWCDIRKDWGEPRILAVGVVEGDTLAVIYTERGQLRRIISARKARKKERELWHWSTSP